jgi:hypothetical protein
MIANSSYRKLAGRGDGWADASNLRRFLLAVVD